MAHMHRSGGVGRDVFDVDLAAAHPGAAVLGALAERGTHDLVIGLGRQAQVDEARSGHARLDHAGILPKLRRQRFAERLRIGPGLLGEDQGRIGGEVAVRGVARRLDHHAGEIEPLGQRPGPGQALERFAHARLEGGEDVHGISIPLAPCRIVTTACASMRRHTNAGGRCHGRQVSREAAHRTSWLLIDPALHEASPNSRHGRISLSSKRHIGRSVRDIQNQARQASQSDTALARAA